MDFEKVGKIIETTDADEANELLEKGLVLLQVARGFSSAGDGDRPVILYSLGQLYES